MEIGVAGGMNGFISISNIFTVDERSCPEFDSLFTNSTGVSQQEMIPAFGKDVTDEFFAVMARLKFPLRKTDKCNIFDMARTLFIYSFTGFIFDQSLNSPLLLNPQSY